MKSIIFNAFFLLSFLVLTSTTISPSEEIAKEIGIALKTGNSEKISVFLNSRVQLLVIDVEDVYSKTQAEVILENFFAEYPPSSFKIINEGGKKTSRFVIGKLLTKNGEFRIYFLIKKVNNEFFIYQLNIEIPAIE